MANKRHRRTAKRREQVRQLSGYGLKNVQIAAVVGISPTTLAKYYDDDLVLGRAKAHAQTAQTLFQMANGRPAEYDRKGNKLLSELLPSVTAAIYYTKAQMGWVETDRHEITGKDGGAVQADTNYKVEVVAVSASGKVKLPVKRPGAPESA